MNVTKETKLGEIEQMMMQDFGIKVNEAIMRQIKDRCLAGWVIWNEHNYIDANSIGDPYISNATRAGVRSTSKRIFYPTAQWNEMVERGAFDEYEL